MEEYKKCVKTKYRNEDMGNLFFDRKCPNCGESTPLSKGKDGYLYYWCRNCYYGKRPPEILSVGQDGFDDPYKNDPRMKRMEKMRKEYFGEKVNVRKNNGEGTSEVDLVIKRYKNKNKKKSEKYYIERMFGRKK